MMGNINIKSLIHTSFLKDSSWCMYVHVYHEIFYLMGGGGGGQNPATKDSYEKEI